MIVTRKSRAGRLAAVAVGLALALTGGALRVEADPPEATGPQLTAQIAEVREKSVVVLALGSEAGVRERQVFEIFEDTRSWTMPFTGGSKAKVARSIIARAVVFSVQPKSALARVYEEKGKLEARQFAVMNPVATAPELPPHISAQRPTGDNASVAWRGRIDVAIDATVDPGKRSFCEWRVDSGTFARGIEVAPGVYRTASFENSWLAPWSRKKCECQVKVVDGSGKSDSLAFTLESQGGGDARASAPRLQRVVYHRPNFAGLRDIGFDRQNQCFYLDGSPGITGDEILYLVGPDGNELGSGKVQGHNFSALAVNESAIYFLDIDDRSVKRYLRNGLPSQILASDFMKIGEKGEGNGRFKEPVDVAVTHDGWLYVLDAGQGCVHCFNPAGEFVSSFGRPGEGDHQLMLPVAIALSDDGRLYILDNGRKRVLVYHDSHLEHDYEVGSKTDELAGLAIDGYGGTICVLEKTQGIRRFNPSGSPVATATTGDEKEFAFLKKPTRVRIDTCRLLHVLDRSGSAIVRFDAGDQGEFVSRMGGEKISTDSRLAAAGNGDVLILDRDNCAIYRLNQNGWILSKAGGEGNDPGQLKKPVGLGVDPEGHVFALDAKKREITKYQAKSGQKLLVFPGEAKFDEVRDIQLGSTREKLMVLQARNGDDDRPISIVNPQSGEVEAQVPPTGSNPFDKAVVGTFVGSFPAGGPKWGDGAYWVADKGGERVQWFVPGPRGATALKEDFDKVTGITASAAGVIFICDRGNKTIHVYSSNGEKLNAIKDDQLGEPQDVATDDLGRLYVFDRSKDGRVLLLSE